MDYWWEALKKFFDARGKAEMKLSASILDRQCEWSISYEWPYRRYVPNMFLNFLETSKVKSPCSFYKIAIRKIPFFLYRNSYKNQTSDAFSTCLLFHLVPRVPGCAADKKTSPTVPYGLIKPVLFMSIYLGQSAIIG